MYFVNTNSGVPLSTLLTFNRLKALSSDAELIANALKKSENDIIEVISTVLWKLSIFFIIL